MSSEKLASGENLLKGELAAAWNILEGSSGDYTDLGVARRFGGSAAAYSLRDIGAMNGSVVRVRREPNDTTAGIDDEEKFSANQVQSGALENWVNGKLEDTLPADVATAAAAYSLRKVRADYANDAVRIRRSSDDIEVDVAFDSDNKVSASSAITNIAEQGGESGQTTATTLGDFISGDVELFNQDFSTGTTGFENLTAGNNTASRITTDGFTSNTSLELNLTNDSLTLNTVRTNKYMLNTSGATYTIKFYAKAVSGSANLNIKIGTESSSETSFSYSDNNGEWKLYTHQFVHNFGVGTGDRNQRVTFFPSADVTTVWRIDNFEIIQNTQDAFVHTWYDQAGSNDAVQETAGNQPKIAENGALLADGLKFNGNSDNFTITNGVSGRSIFAVTNQNIDTTGGGSGGYGQDGISALLGTAGTNSYIFVTNNNPAFNSYAISLDGAASDSGQFASNGQTLSASGGNIGTYGDIPSDTNSLLSIIYGAGDPANTWNRLGSGISGNILMQGSMSEVILYTSDQSDNRFKIESNMNNYYGLYNDANEVTGAFTASGQNSFTANGTNGFTIESATANAFAGIELNEKVPDNDIIYISFNADLSVSGTASPTVALRKTSISGTVSSDSPSSGEPAVTQGFNSFGLVCSDADAKFVTFLEDADNVSYTISDFKVSRIARNGFVETLYDQSSNGRDISQASASNQPTIVSNGGIYKTGAYPSIRYTDTSATYLVTESYSPVEQGGSGMPNFTLFAVTGIPEASGLDSIVSAGGSEGSNAIGGFKLRHLKDGSGNIDSRIDIAQTGVSPHQANAQSNNATPQSVNLLTSYLDSTDDELFAQQNSGTSGTTTTTLIPLSGQGAENDNLKVGTDMYNNSPRASYLGEILEVILYTDSKKSELSDLTNEINNFYNI